MTVNETLMGDGAFSIQLNPDVRGEIASLLLSERYALVKIYRARLPVQAVASGAIPLYTGVRLGSRQWGEVNGRSPLWLLGQPLSGSGKVGDPGWIGAFKIIDNSTVGVGLSAWMAAAMANGITIGAVLGTAAVLQTALEGSARQVVDYVCAQLGAEYQVTSDLKFYAGTRTQLFGDPAEPIIPFVAPDSAGYDDRLIGLAQTSATLTVTDQDRVNRVLSFSSGGGGLYDTGAPADGFNAPDGTQLDMTLYDNSYTTDAEAQAGRDAAYASKGDTARTFTMTTAPFDVDRWNDSGPDRRHTLPGSTIGAYNPRQNVFDLANPTPYRGRVIFPVAIRCVGVEWPMRPGYGVYLDNRHNGGVITDLTPYVQPETGDATLTLGQLPKQLDGTRRLVQP